MSALVLIMSSSSKMYVGNLSWTTSDDTLHQTFEKFGPITDVVVMRDGKTDRSLRFGFVTFANKTHAKIAIQAMAGSELDSRRIRVNIATSELVGGGSRLSSRSRRSISPSDDPPYSLEELYNPEDGDKLRNKASLLARDSKPISACARCRNAKIKCDGKLPVCSPCERAGEVMECSSANDQFTKGKKRSYVSTRKSRIERLENRKGSQPLNVSGTDEETSDSSLAPSNEPALTQLLPEDHLFERSRLSLVTLAKALQEAKGVQLQDRGWRLGLHFNYFSGIELVDWFLDNFRDIDDLTEAESFGNELVKEGLFVPIDVDTIFGTGGLSAK